MVLRWNVVPSRLRKNIRIEAIWRFNRHARREKTAISFSMGWDAETYNKETIKNEFLWKQLFFTIKEGKLFCQAEFDESLS